MLENQSHTRNNCEDKSGPMPQEIIEERIRNHNSENFKGESRKDFEKFDEMDRVTLKLLESVENVEDNG